MDQNDFMLLQADEVIEDNFGMGELQQELAHIETDEYLRANEDEI